MECVQVQPIYPIVIVWLVYGSVVNPETSSATAMCSTSVEDHPGYTWWHHNLTRNSKMAVGTVHVTIGVIMNQQVVLLTTWQWASDPKWSSEGEFYALTFVWQWYLPLIVHITGVGFGPVRRLKQTTVPWQTNGCCRPVLVNGVEIAFKSSANRTVAGSGTEYDFSQICRCSYGTRSSEPTERSKVVALLTVTIKDSKLIFVTQRVVASNTIRLSITRDLDDVAGVRKFNEPLTSDICWICFWPVWSLKWSMFGREVVLAWCCKLCTIHKHMHGIHTQGVLLTPSS